MHEECIECFLQDCFRYIGEHKEVPEPDILARYMIVSRWRKGQRNTIIYRASILHKCY